jgi:hypothetical protein
LDDISLYFSANSCDQAPKPITRHIIVSAPPVVATPLPENGLTPDGPYQNPPRFSYPKEVLKHKFLPYGAQSSGDGIAQVIEEDVVMVDGAELEENTGVEPPVKAVKEKKNKKRKVDEVSPKTKKTKKIKTDVAT